jgi:DNA-binding transcriptional regulator YiaG
LKDGRTLRIRPAATAGEVSRIRKRLGLTQRELVNLVGVATNSVARWERGELGIRESAARLMRLLVAQTATTTKRSKKRG